MIQARQWAASVATGFLFLAGASGLVLAEEGAGILTGRDLAKRTVTVDARAYRVTEQTLIKDLEGLPVELEALPDPSRAPLFCEYDAADARGGPVLMRLRLVEIPE